jgi:hypothetical protein
MSPASSNIEEKSEVFSLVSQYPGTPEPELVVFRTYGNYFVAAPLLRSTQEGKISQVEKKIYFLKMDQMDQIPLISEKVGPLMVKQ